MNEIINTSNLVKAVLQKHPMARNSDNYLYYVICRGQLETIGLNIDNISLSNALLFRKEYGLPPFETVRRTRQKIQKAHPELSCNETVAESRAEQEAKFYEYAKGAAI